MAVELEAKARIVEAMMLLNFILMVMFFLYVVRRQD